MTVSRRFGDEDIRVLLESYDVESVLERRSASGVEMNVVVIVIKW